MSAAKVLLMGAIGVGAVALFLHAHSANASPNTIPPEWRPPPGSSVTTFPPPITGTGMRMLKRTSWAVQANSSGQQAGTFLLTQNADDPNDWVLVFVSAAGGAGILGHSDTPMGGLLAQAVAAGH